MNSLGDIRNTLSAALASDALVRIVVTRVALKTGIDLHGVSVTPAIETPENVERVLRALSELGFTTSSLQAVASKRAMAATAR